MPLNGGIKQRLRQDRQGEVAEPIVASESKQRTFSGGGRQRSNTIGGFLTGMYLCGRISAPDLQEGAWGTNALLANTVPGGGEWPLRFAILLATSLCWRHPDEKNKKWPLGHF